MPASTKTPGVWNGYQENQNPGTLAGNGPGPGVKQAGDQTDQQYHATHSAGPVPSAAGGSYTNAPQQQANISRYRGGSSIPMPGAGSPHYPGYNPATDPNNSDPNYVPSQVPIYPGEVPGSYHTSSASTGSQPSAPSSTDPNSPMSAAQAMGYYNQQAINQATQANRPTINTPFGSQQWTKDANGNWTMGVGFGGPLAGGVDNLTHSVARNLSAPIGNGDQARDQAIQSAYGQATSRLDPQWQQNDEQLGAQLAAQGLDPNSQAYRTAMQQNSFAKNDAYTSAMNAAVGQGTAAQQATFNENLQAHETPLNDLRSVYGLLPGTGFNSAGTAQTPDYLSAQNSSIQQQLMQQQITAQEISAAAQAGSSIVNAASSDERVKQNIIRHPFQVVPGVPAASFEYKAQPGQRYMGVIAQDLEKVAPQHVATGPDGIKRVSEPFRPFQVGPSAGFKPFGGG